MKLREKNKTYQDRGSLEKAKVHPPPQSLRQEVATT